MPPRHAVVDHIFGLEPGARSAAVRVARERLDSLPIPAFVHGSIELVRLRGELQGVLAAAEARDGDATRLLAWGRAEWIRGGSHLAYLDLLARFGSRDHASELALSLLEDEGPDAERRAPVGPDRDAVRAFLAELLELPAGFEAALVALASSPVLEGWLALGRFTTPTSRERRARYSISRLVELGARADDVFALAATDGVGAVIVRLVERGQVTPTRIMAFACELSRPERREFCALAFRAAVVRGDAFVAVRAYRTARDAGRAASDLAADRAFADARGNASVRRALGIHRPEADGSESGL